MRHQPGATLAQTPQADPGRLYVLDRDVLRREGGHLLIGGVPPRLLRLSPSGGTALDQLLAGESSAASRVLGPLLVERGVIHPVASPSAAESVSFVIPVRNGGDGLPTLVRSLLRWGPVLVVDDGSVDGTPERAAGAGAEVIGNDHRPGPAGARNAGMHWTTAEFIAFIDADCTSRSAWAGPLVALLRKEPRLAIAAPRIRGGAGAGALAAYERARSPLDLGPDPARVGSGGRIGFVPSTALVVRRRALVELGGFDEDLRFGEDVDLVWRAVAAGWSARYAPEVSVEHRPRAGLYAWGRQRYEYGSSAAPLHRRHPGSVAPLGLDASTTGLVAVALVSGPAAAAAAAIVRVGLTSIRQRDSGGRAALARFALRTQIAALPQVARAMVRDWLPVTVAATLLSSRARRLALLAVAIDAAAAPGCRRRGLLANLALRTSENACYAAGLWAGAVRDRSGGALLPRPPAGPTGPKARTFHSVPTPDCGQAPPDQGKKEH